MRPTSLSGRPPSSRPDGGHRAALAARAESPDAGASADGILFEDAFGDAASRRTTRRAARAWHPAERLAPAIAALVDWDPGDLPIVPVLLDLPENALREAMRQRAIAWGTST